tara:strand:+ start:1149 stop:1331 length:183 start_codon:yes stop_codon:yes gene_type:complete
MTMAKWTVPDDKDFTIQAKITKAMQKNNLTVDEVLEAIDAYTNNKQFEADLYNTYLGNAE